MLAALTGIAATAAPAMADAATTVHITGPASITIGTTQTKTFTVTGTLTTPVPTDTDVHWSVERNSKSCFLFEYGDVNGTATGGFSEHGYIQPGELTNDCAGKAVLDVSAIDNSDTGGIGSAKAPVNVLRAARWQTFNAHPEPVRKGGTLTIDGTLQRANWDDDHYHRYTNQTVQLQFRTTTGTYSTVKTVTSATGDFSTKATQTVAGCWRYVFAGTSTTGPATATGDCVAISK
jgi:hypothetical protein